MSTWLHYLRFIHHNYCVSSDGGKSFASSGKRSPMPGIDAILPSRAWSLYSDGPIGIGFITSRNRRVSMSQYLSKKRRRQMILVSMLRRGEHLTLDSFVAYLKRKHVDVAVCKKTIQRDVDDLRDRLHAPVGYDSNHHTFKLDDMDWFYPSAELEGDGLFAAMICSRVAEPLLPSSIHGPMQDVLQASLAAGEPDDIDPDILNSLIHATTTGPSLDPKIYETIEHAWKLGHRCHIEYSKPGEAKSSRDIDIHVLFLAGSAWYTRAWCHSRKALRSFALHRIVSAVTFDIGFKRRADVIAEVRRGTVFDGDLVHDVVLRCSAAKSVIIREREWFPGQEVRDLADGELEVRYPSVPEAPLLWWLLSYAGHLVAHSPPTLRAAVHRAATILRDKHGEGD